MGDLNSSSMWMKFGVLFTIIAWGFHLFSFNISGWATTSSRYGYDSHGDKHSWFQAVEAFEVIGYLCALVAVVLVLCLVFIDEVQGNKVAHIFFIVLSIVAGICMIIGVAIFESETKTKFVYSALVCVTGGILDVIAGIFSILDMKGVNVGK